MRTRDESPNPFTVAATYDCRIEGCDSCYKCNAVLKDPDTVQEGTLTVVTCRRCGYKNNFKNYKRSESKRLDV